MKYTVKKTWDEKEYIEAENADGVISFIPTDPANSDYQRYLNPETEQSTPNLAP